jgi:4-hydroxy-tetrahydrodipicolinate reductase
MRVLVIGDGKMGHALVECLRARGHTLAAMLGMADNLGGGGIARFRGAVDVAIEFTEPAAAAANVRACVDTAIPVVVGTTGWSAEREEVEAYVRAGGGALLAAANFSVGVALVVELAKAAGQLIHAQPQFRPALIETHHAQKQDAPSGTALTLAAALSGSMGGVAAPIASVRVGSVPGTHELVLDAPFEQIVLRHEARDRRVFADGAVHAAEWLAGKRGVYAMRDVLGIGAATP